MHVSVSVLNTSALTCIQGMPMELGMPQVQGDIMAGQLGLSAFWEMLWFQLII